MTDFTDPHSRPTPVSVPLSLSSDPQPAEIQTHTHSSPALTNDQKTGPDTNVQLVDNLLSASQKLRTLLQLHYAEFGLNEVRYTVLNFIHQTKEDGCSQAELADKLQQSESSVSTLIERMRNSGLIYPLRSKQDRRKRILVLTEHGRELMEKVETCHTDRMRHLLLKLKLHNEEQLKISMQDLVNKIDTISPDWFKQISHDFSDTSAAA